MKELLSNVLAEGYRIDKKIKTIYVGYSKRFDLSESVIQLRDKYGYVIQTEIE